MIASLSAAVVLLSLLFLPNSAAACSGPGASALMAAASRLGTLYLLIGIAVALPAIAMALRRGKLAAAAILLTLLFFHSGWWVSAYVGDCGGGRESGSLYFTTFIALVAMAPGVTSLRTRWSPLSALVLFGLAGADSLNASAAWNGFSPGYLLLIEWPALFVFALVVIEWVIGLPLTEAVARRAALEPVQRRFLLVASLILLPMAASLALLLAWQVSNAALLMRGGGAVREMLHMRDLDQGAG